MKRLPQQHANHVVRRERSLRSLAHLVALLCCGVVLAGGFVYAAGRHFAAVEYGYRSEELRRERDRLREERAQLQLQFEEAAAPSRLEQAARAIGLQPVKPVQINQVKQSLIPKTIARSGERSPTSYANASALISPTSATLHH